MVTFGRMGNGSERSGLTRDWSPSFFSSSLPALSSTAPGPLNEVGSMNGDRDGDRLSSPFAAD